MSKEQPMQKLHRDSNGVVRFIPNKIVEFLLDQGGFDMNALALMNFTEEDRRQFAQLIGYSVDGYCTLSYVTQKSGEKAYKKYDALMVKEKSKL